MNRVICVQTRSQLQAKPGIVIMWSGSITSIPSPWVLCNGSNGSPDLRDRFVEGSTSTLAAGDRLVSFPIASEGSLWYALCYIYCPIAGNTFEMAGGTLCMLWTDLDPYAEGTIPDGFRLCDGSIDPAPPYLPQTPDMTGAYVIGSGGTYSRGDLLTISVAASGSTPQAYRLHWLYFHRED